MRTYKRKTMNKQEKVSQMPNNLNSEQNKKQKSLLR